MSGHIQLPKPKKSPRRIMQAKYDDTCGICLQDVLQGQDIEIQNGSIVHHHCAKEG